MSAYFFLTNHYSRIFRLNATEFSKGSWWLESLDYEPFVQKPFSLLFRLGPENLYPVRAWDDWRTWLRCCTTAPQCRVSSEALDSVFASSSCPEPQCLGLTQRMRLAGFWHPFYFSSLTTYFRMDKSLEGKDGPCRGSHSFCDLVPSYLHCLLTFTQVILMYSFPNTELLGIVLSIVLRAATLQEQK